MVEGKMTTNYLKTQQRPNRDKTYHDDTCNKTNCSRV